MPNKLTGCHSRNCPALPVVVVLEVSCGEHAGDVLRYYGYYGDSAFNSIECTVTVMPAVCRSVVIGAPEMVEAVGRQA